LCVVEWNSFCWCGSDSWFVSTSCCFRLLNWRWNWVLGPSFQLKRKRSMNQRSSCNLRFKVWRLKRCHCFYWWILLWSVALVLIRPSFALDIKSTCVYVQVQLQCKIKLESVQFRLCKALLEKEILQVSILNLVTFSCVQNFEWLTIQLIRK